MPRGVKGLVSSNHTTRETIPISWVDDSSSNPSSDGPNIYRDTLSSILAPANAKLPPRPSSKIRMGSRQNESDYQPEIVNGKTLETTKKKQSRKGVSRNTEKKFSSTVERRRPASTSTKGNMKNGQASSGRNLHKDNSTLGKNRSRSTRDYSMMPCHRLRGEISHRANAAQEAARGLLADVTQDNQSLNSPYEGSVSKTTTTLMKAKLNKSR